MKIRYTNEAMQDLKRLREFIRVKNPTAANQVARSIRDSIRLLGEQPKMGRPIEDMPETYREWLITFGESGYIARYRLDVEFVVILGIRHQKELNKGE